VYRIGREALANAFRHAQASNIETVLEYTSDRFRMVVRDNGCGMDPDMLQSGRPGHWGLSGIARALDPDRCAAQGPERPRRGYGD